MLKFIRGKGQQPSAERQKLQRELFAFRKTVQHGFPHKPTALAWDPALRLLAVATSSGALKVIGKPGVEFYGQHHTQASVTRVIFLPNQGRLVTLCDDNSLHLWEINDGCLEEIKSQIFEGKLKKISAMCLESGGDLLLLGTEGGNVYFLSLKTFEMLDTIIYLDIVMQNVSANYKITNPGAVEAIAEEPSNPDHLLIGYSRGLIVLWDRTVPGPKQTFHNPQQLESLCWDSSGKKFASSHNDGSYAFWDVAVEEKPTEDPTALYGPFPCKPVTKLIWRQTSEQDLIIFSGGMPRASYNEKCTVTVYGSNGKIHSVLEFTSKVIDFVCIDGDPDNVGGILVVLAEEELVAVNLKEDDLKMISLPYLQSLHASAVTCSYHVSNVPQQLYDSLKHAGQRQIQDVYSDRVWPELGGIVLGNSDAAVTTENTAGGGKHEVLLTGHEDGTVRFWDCKSVALSPLYKFSSSPFFTNEEPASPVEEEDEWPPFKKIGTFDPYSDDPRLAVKKVWLCPVSGTLVVAGTAGFVIVANVSDEDVSKEITEVKMNIVSDRDNFVWKGHEALQCSKLVVNQSRGLQVTSILQLHPPAAATAVACSTQLGLLGVGTAHGLALYDFVRSKPVLTKCTLNPNDLSGAGDAPISRRKSFKKSLRESFRRLRKGRSTRGGGGGDRRSPTRSPAAGGDKKDVTSPTSPGSGDAKPVERQIEARPVDDSLGSIVRCLCFANTFLVSLQYVTPTFWAGTNNGTVYAFTITLSASQRKEKDVTCQLGKEIQLKHRAPVLSVSVIDGHGLPLVDNMGAGQQQQTVTPPHRVVICSEEQFKIFTLPSLKPLCKLKLTAHEGCRVRRVSYGRFTTPNKKTTDVCLMCLTNIGDCLILNLPELRRQLNAAVVPREDINGITSLVFTDDGEAFYLHSSSEFQRVTLSTTKVTAVTCKLELPEGAREKAKHNGAAESDNDDNETEEEEHVVEESAAAATASAGAGEPVVGKETVEAAEKIEEKSNNNLVNDGNTPVVNGTGSPGDIKENGVSDHDVSSLGDITVDSVKDHLLNSNHSINEVNHEETKTSVVVKTTTTTIITESAVNTQQSAN